MWDLNIIETYAKRAWGDLPIRSTRVAPCFRIEAFPYRPNGQQSLEADSLDYSEQKKNQNDEQYEADTAAAVITKSWTQAITSKTEHQNQDNKKNQHFRVSVGGEDSRAEGVMQIFRYVQRIITN